MKKYEHKVIESKWQGIWKENNLYTTPDTAKGKDNFYLLVEFPYPSGNLHVGHWYAFAVPDILARVLRMQGKNVLYPIGFDAFGLPAENAAIKNKLNPRTWTEGNIEYMEKQIASMGASFDWSRKVITCDPAYYKWTQWLFLQLFKKGLVYQKETAVNWCPKDKTVLANEQVINGKCERCDSVVEQKQMLQWNIKITDYADRLAADLDALDWPKEIKESQKNWIGRSEGAEIDFKIKGGNEVVRVFTTRPDTLYGATYLVLAPEHAMVESLRTRITNWDAVEAYRAQAQKKSDLDRQMDTKEKTGVRLEGIDALNPATAENIPVYIADYVLPQYGTGAIMAVPAHDERDWDFAKKFDLPVRQVVAPVLRSIAGGDAVRPGLPFKDRDAVMCIVKHWEKDEYLCIQWRDFTDIRGFISGGIEPGEEPVAAGIREIQEESGYVNPKFVRQVGGFSYIEFYHQIKKINVRARFRYLYFELQNGEQVPIAEEESNLHALLWKKPEEILGFLSLREKDAIWRAFFGHEQATTGDGFLVNSGSYDGLSSEEAKRKITESFGTPKTTYKMRDWVVSRQRYWGVPIPIIHCGKCGTVAEKDDNLPVVLPEVDDYLPDGSGKSPLAKAKSWVETACPTCGSRAERETDTLDTFVDSSWYFLRYTDPKNEKEFASAEKMRNWMPVDLYSGGAEHTTMHLLYSRFWHKALFDLGLVADSEPYTRRMNRSLILGPDGQKMSKSRGNVIDPDEAVERLGADTVRMYLAFIGPYNEVSSYPWNPNGVVGIRRFLERVCHMSDAVQEGDATELDVLLQKTVKKVGEDIAALKFNTAVSALMIFLNAMEKTKAIGKDQWTKFLKLLAPFAPHLAEELWHELGNEVSIHTQKWPIFDSAHLKDEMITIAIQINGKLRGSVSVPADADKEALEHAAREAVAGKLEGKRVIRTVVVPGRLVNFVLEN